MSMHLLVIIIWLAWSARNIELSKFMAAVWAVFFVARIWGRCRSRCRVFNLGLVKAVHGVELCVEQALMFICQCIVKI